MGEQYDGQIGSVAEMLGRPANDPTCQRYNNGSFIIIYLSPQDYHRVHCHDGGTLRDLQYQPGQLYQYSRLQHERFLIYSIEMNDWSFTLSISIEATYRVFYQ